MKHFFSQQWIPSTTRFFRILDKNINRKNWVLFCYARRMERRDMLASLKDVLKHIGLIRLRLD